MLHTTVLSFSCSACDTEITVLRTFEGNSITTDGSDGIIDIILSLQRRVDVHHLKVHWNTAEPTAQTHKLHGEATAHCAVVDTLNRVQFNSDQPENLSDMIEQLWADSIPRYEGHSVSASILCRRGL